MWRKILVVVLVAVLSVTTASAQIGLGGIVYDPTNYANALLRYNQLVQQLIQLKQTYDLALHMAHNLQNMPARYRAAFSQWRNLTALDVYGNTAEWVNGVNSGLDVPAGYQQATTQLGVYDPAMLAGMTPDELARVESQYASVELADGANANALTAVGAIRANAQLLENQLNNLEQDSLSADPNLNSEVEVLNKISAANVLTLRSVQDSNKLLTSLLEQEVIASKQQRETTANAINADISRRANLLANMNQVAGTLADSLQNFRMP
ncbi:MAG: hypothetical protein JO119_21885 [Acidobacteria bacterium]|nr:hypothetical protein [Acidobacteriota bacterium]